MEYAVRGEVVIAADKIQAELKQGTSTTYPFDHIIYTNVGNPHSVGQKPLTWPRQVLALVDLPNANGVDHPLASQIFPADAIQRAREIKKGLGGMGTGAYSHSQGARCFRDDVVAFIQDRDGGVPCNPNDIFLTNGASAAIRMILQALVTDSKW
jgi:aspartate/methionine/tyrosine aminotransferase